MSPVLRCLAVALIATATTGCATILSGTTQPVQVSTQPAGAEVLINGAPVGRAPLIVEIPRDDQVTVGARAAGYPDTQVMLRRGFNPISLVNLLFLPGWLVDILTGAIYELEPGYLYLDLTRPGTYMPYGAYPLPQMSAPPPPPPDGTPPAPPASSPQAPPAPAAPQAPAAPPAPPQPAAPPETAPAQPTPR